MLTLERRIEAFSALGDILLGSVSGNSHGQSEIFTSLIDSLNGSNPWFTPDNVRMAIKSTGEMISNENLLKWLSHYPEIDKPHTPARIGVVMAGNIPLVGFHDFLSVLFTGNIVNGKLSSKDELLMKAVAATLIEIEPGLREYIDLTTDKITGFKGVIATGSDNTSRYFEYYFRSYPSVIRHNRNSIAILDGNESDEELTLLGKDIFTYFGLGCRNVSKLYIPESYDVNRFAGLWSKYDNLRSHHKYASNYDHNKAVFIVNREPFTDTGFVLLRNESSLTPPMAVLNYEFYSSADALKSQIRSLSERIQCIAGREYSAFGQAQCPNLWDYADEIDTVSFLLKNFSLE
ncbi:MAG TPA: acyl-CoA reductase [Bacteroidales bacterium]|nr:acyl-CoA reductase [Bacteroidales bacterium]